MITGFSVLFVTRWWLSFSGAGYGLYRGCWSSIVEADLKSYPPSCHHVRTRTYGRLQDQLPARCLDNPPWSFATSEVTPVSPRPIRPPYSACTTRGGLNPMPFYGGVATAFLADTRVGSRLPGSSEKGLSLSPHQPELLSAEPRIEPPVCTGTNGYSSTALWPTRSLELARERQIDRSIFLRLARWTVFSSSAVKFRSRSLLLR